MIATSKVFVVSHTHWDREWYLTREQTRLLLLDVMDELLSILSEQKNFVFMLDGQTILLEDYLEIRPDRRDEIAGYVRQGRLFIGPWYVLPDELLISGESHIRNFLIGRELCREFGGAMEVGYLPDSFGHPSQMPQILKGLGMNEIVFWRGLGPDVHDTEFIWKGPDGTEILGVNMPYSYGVAACMPDDPGAFVDRLRRKIELLAPLSPSGLVLLMNGVDHVAPQRSLEANLKSARQRLSGVELVHAGLGEYLAELHSRGTPRERTTGELRSGFRSYLLGGTLSTRMYLKIANFRAETLLEKHAEPLSVLATALFGAPYPEHELRHAWKQLLSNLPHDSICGCGIDAIHEEMMLRYRAIEEICRNLVDRSAAALRALIDPAAERRATAGYHGSILVFNSALTAREDVVYASIEAVPRLVRKVNYETGELEEHPVEPLPELPTGAVVVAPDGTETEASVRKVAEREVMRLSPDTQPEMYRAVTLELIFPVSKLPALGYAIYDYRLTYGSALPAPAGNHIENELLRVEYDPTSAALRVLDKRNGQWYDGLHRIEDGGDAGDEYTYSQPRQDLRAGLLPERTSARVGGTRRHPELILNGELEVPARLAPGREIRSLERVAVGVETRVALSAGLARIDIQTTITNAADDHRLRVLFPLGARASRGSSESLFSIEERSAQGRNPTEFAGWVEPPSSFPQKAFTTLQGEQRGLTVAVRGIPECEIVESGEGSAIAVTLLRSVGWLSRSDLLARKGNGGWPIPTPGAQCMGSYRFEYSVLPHNQGERPAEIAARARDFVYPPLAVALGNDEVREPNRVRSLVGTDRSEVVFSALKKAEGRDSYILRCWNGSGEELDAQLAFGFGVREAYEVTLSEERERAVPLAAGRCALRFGPWKIVSLELVT